MKKRKIVSTLLALLLLASLPVSALAAEWDISKGDITVNAGSGGQTVTQGSQVDVPDSAPVITGSSTENTLTINAEKDQTANVTLSDVNIDVSSEGKAAVTTTGEGNVSIELNGDNTLKSGKGHAGLEKKNGGKLTAEGGKYGAGIGGGDQGAGSGITITGGEIKATGGQYGAGIGGGKGDGSDITISGGEVNATGGTSGAGIGGGYNGNGSDITVSGAAKLKVQGGVGDGFYGAGAGIGNGGNCDERAIPVTGAEVVPDTSGLTTAGRIEYYALGADMENDKPTSITFGTSSQPEKPIVPEQPEAERGMDAPLYRVTDKDGRDIVYTAERKDGAGIGGGLRSKGKDITVSGDTKLKVQGGDEDHYDGAGAGIGDGGSNAYGTKILGAEVEPDTSGLTTNGSIAYYAPGADMEKDTPTSTTFGTSSQPEKPIDPGAERGADAPLYRVTDKYGRNIAYTTEQKGGVLTVTVDEDFAVLTGSLSGMTALRARGVEKIIFVTNGAKTAVKLSTIISKLTANGVFRLTHDGKAATFTLG